MTDIWGAVNEGIQASQSIQDNYWHNSAQNALTQMYGPIAGNPQGALQMQQYNYLGSLDPLLLQSQGLQNQGQGITNQTNAGMMPGRINEATGQGLTSLAGGTTATEAQPSAAQATIAQNTGTAQTAVPQAQVGLANNAAIAQQNQVTAGGAAAAGHAQRMATFTQTARNYLQNHPDDAQGAYNAGMAASKVGMTPQDVQAAQSVYPQFVKDPIGTLDQLDTGNTAYWNSQVMGLTPVQRAEIAKAGVGVAETQANIYKNNYENYTNAKGQEDEIVNKSGNIGLALRGAQSGQAALADMERMLPQMSANRLIGVANGEFQPTSAEAQFMHDAEQVKSSLSMAALTNGKETVGGSLGIRNSTEFDKAGEAISDFHLGYDPARTKEQIGLAKGYLGQLESNADTYLQNNNKDYGGAVSRRKILENNLNMSASALPGAQGYAPGSAAQAPPAQPAQPALSSGAPTAGSAVPSVGAPVAPPAALTPGPQSSAAPASPSPAFASYGGGPLKVPSAAMASSSEGMGQPYAGGFTDPDQAKTYLSRTAIGSAASRADDIPKLNPEFATRLASAVQDARAQGLQVSVFSGARSPGATAAQHSSASAFDQNGYSLHPVGLATDINIAGGEAANSPAFQKWANIAQAHGIYNPYGITNPREYNHWQALPLPGEAYGGSRAPWSQYYSDGHQTPERAQQMWAAEQIPGAPEAHVAISHAPAAQAAAIPTPQSRPTTPAQAVAAQASTGAPLRVNSLVASQPGYAGVDANGNARFDTPAHQQAAAQALASRAAPPPPTRVAQAAPPAQGMPAPQQIAPQSMPAPQQAAPPQNALAALVPPSRPSTPTPTRVAQAAPPTRVAQAAPPPPAQRYAPPPQAYAPLQPIAGPQPGGAQGMAPMPQPQAAPPPAQQQQIQSQPNMQAQSPGVMARPNFSQAPQRSGSSGSPSAIMPSGGVHTAATGQETPPVLPQSVYLNHTPDHVLAGRELLAKYLRPRDQQQRAS
jgi:hypothetical protein